MGLFSSLFSKKPSAAVPAALYERFVVDLTALTCGGTKLGAAATPDACYHAFLAGGRFLDEARGVELTFENGRLDSIFLDLARYPGGLVHRGDSDRLSAHTTMREALDLFGTPYWHDDGEAESILFYEDGSVELQLEFPDKERLGFITITTDPILARADQRAAYGVTNDWPPTR